MPTQSSSSNDTAILIQMIRFVKKHLFLFFWVGLISFVVTLAFSFLLTPRYRSVSILMPTATSSLSRPLFSAGYYKEDYLEYGIEKDCEYMMQILKSPDIAFKTIEHFDLFSHWKIKPDSKKRYSQAYTVYKNNVSIKRTENLGVEVSVEDENPVMAVDMVNYIVSQYDSLRNTMRMERATAASSLAYHTRDLLREEMKFWEDSIQRIREQGVMNYEDFTARMYQELAKNVAKGDQPAVRRIEEKLKKYEELGGSYVDISGYLEAKREQLAEMESRIVQIKADAVESIPYKFVVTKPMPADDKIYPKRLIMSITVSILTLLMTLIILAGIEKWRQIAKDL